ncbi:futalosine hydrolase [Sphingobacterium sp. lm-10]|uniref:futalosine hydrolase n=1 Tax=Sphingobacterium sp. lm-10 TaxID=2944904 RepID=UPI002021078C|nr:futalosine hydrolase [Sphingobacterium sp. lm-10]MCL7988582.1 futalosine hydrolase [Sphingobacterium sp. lm-10]
MEILIVAATARELEPSLLFLKDQEIDTLITGVGMVETAFALGNKLAAKKYDLLINVGVAGSFSPLLQLGDVVEVEQDQLIELGAQDGEQFLTIEDLGLGQYLFVPALRADPIPKTGLEKVHGITVNTVHGNADAIESISKRFSGSVTIESMEGAAAFLAAEKKSISALQVRAISNYVEHRDTSRWDIPLAIEKLHEWLRRYVVCLRS